MPQTRKRKATEKLFENTDQKVRKKPLVNGEKSAKIKGHSQALEDETVIKRRGRPKLEKTISQSPQSSQVKTLKSKNSSSLLNNNLKLKKSKVVLSPLKLKSEADSFVDIPKAFHSSDSVIRVEESIKEEIFQKSIIEKPADDSDSSSESEWEEVEESCDISLEDYKPNIPEEGVEITIKCPDLNIRKQKKKFDENEWIRLHVNRVRKDVQLSVHKTHLLCLLAHGIYVNQTLNSDSLKGLALSLIPNELLTCAFIKKVDKLDDSGVEKIVAWFRSTFSFENKKAAFIDLFLSLTDSFQSQKAMNASEYNLMFIIIARTLGLKVRYCLSLYPVTYKACNLIKKPGSKKKDSKPCASKEDDASSSSKKTQKKAIKKDNVSKKAKQNNSQSEVKKEGVSKKIKLEHFSHESNVQRPKRSKRKSYKVSSDENDTDDEDFIMENNSCGEDEEIDNKSFKLKSTKRNPNRKILSSDSDIGSQSDILSSNPETNSVVCWAEIFCKSIKQWISVECVNNIVDKPYDIEVIVPQPVSYIIAIDNQTFIKDVTRRYCNNYMTSTIKLRVDPDWWEETIEPFSPPNSKLNKDEEKKLEEMLVNKPLPTTLQGFKNHFLYALKRHLLKFEAIYPPNAPPVGFFRGEPVYARDCVHQLHSRETWLKEARVVRIGEEPYKIVKARPKWDKIAGVLRTDLPLEIFGKWQTEPYEPPIAVGGKVPRSEYGNVELFKPCMLPKGTVHLQLPGLNRIAKKLNIDCAAAVVGFDGHKGSVHPIFDGFVICEEFKDVIIAAWDEEQENIRKRGEEKREKRIYGNWRKLIRGLLIRERIKLKYDTK